MDNENLTILYQDDEYVAVNKPSGLLVHRSMIDSKEKKFALQTVRNQVGKHVYPVHRLDKATSGVLLFALHPEAARLMSQLFTDRDITKTYLAIVRGHSQSGIIDHAIKERYDRATDKKAQQDKQPQEAITDYHTLAKVELPFAVGPYATARYSLTQLMPKTGRKHQLRRHMAYISHHIIGDTTYGDGKHNRFFRSQFNSRRLLLAAVELSFTHPYSKKQIIVSAPLQDNFQAIVSSFEWADIVPDRWRNDCE